MALRKPPRPTTRQCSEAIASAMPNWTTSPLVATVLPPGEGFGPGRTGAIGHLVRRLTMVSPSLVIGGPQAGPIFDNVLFRPAKPSPWRLGNVNQRYTASVARILGETRPEIVEVWNRPEIALALMDRFPRLPVMLFLQNDPQSMRGARTPAQRHLLLDRLARVVTASAFLSRRMIEGVPSPARSPFVIPNWLDLAALPPEGPRENLILFTGRVVPEKGTDSFVAACAAALPRLPGWRAEIIGADRFRSDAPDTGFVRSVRTAAEAAGVAMLGYRDHPEVLASLARSAIAAVPSRWDEPFGLAALEAMACGAALLCSRRGGLPEVTADAAVFIDPDDPAGFADTIVSLAQDANRLAALAQAGRARARRFGVEAAALQLAVLRREILPAGGSPPPPHLYSAEQRR